MYRICEMKGRTHILFAALFLGLVWALTSLSSRVAAQPSGKAQLVSSPVDTNSPLAWDAMTKEYDAKPGEITNNFTFSVTNISPFPVEIIQMRPSCGCTVAKLPKQPWRLDPGSNGQARVTINFEGKYGTVTKSIAVAASQITPSGTVKFIQDLFIVVEIPYTTNSPPPTNSISTSSPGTDRNDNMELARHDRQAVFKGECASCHAKTAEGKTGEELYHAVCAICHESPQRASMVPDLTVAKVPRTQAYWLSWIKYGKGGTLMPGFSNAKSVGGPLTTNQIQSLVAYLQKKYPSQAAALK